MADVQVNYDILWGTSQTPGHTKLTYDVATNNTSVTLNLQRVDYWSDGVVPGTGNYFDKYSYVYYGTSEHTWENESWYDDDSQINPATFASTNIGITKVYPRTHVSYQVYVILASYQAKRAQRVITIPAKPTYAISYNANGGSGAPSAQTKWHGEDLALSSTQPTRVGYSFSCWNTRADGSGTNYSSGSTFSVDANTVLYAVWHELPNITSVSAVRVGEDSSAEDPCGGRIAVSFSWSNTPGAGIFVFEVRVTPSITGYSTLVDTWSPGTVVQSGTHTMVLGDSSTWFDETVYRAVFPDVSYAVDVIAYNDYGDTVKSYTLNPVSSNVYSRPLAAPTLMRSDAHSNSDICGEYIDVVTAITTYSSSDDDVVVYSHVAEVIASGWIGDLDAVIDVSPDKKSGHALMGPFDARLLTPQSALTMKITIADKFYTVTNRHVLPAATAYQLPTIEITGIRRVAPDGVTEDALGGYLLVTGRYTITETNTQQQPTSSTGKVSATPGGSALPTVVHFIDDSGPAQSRHDAWEYPNDEDWYDPIPVGGAYTLSKTPNGTVTVMAERLVAVPEGELGSSYTYEPDDEFTVGVAATSTRLWISYDGDKTFTALLPENANGSNDKLIRCTFDYEYNEGVPSTTAGTAEGPNTIDARPGRKTAVQTFGELLLSVMRPDEVYYATFTVSDRFNTASTTVQVPVSNYTFPMVYDLEPKRVIMVPDNPALPGGPSHPEPSDDGTDLLVDVSWAIYGSVTQTEPQEFNVTVVSEEGQTIVDRDCSLPAMTSGRPSELLFKSGDPDISLPVPFSQDLQYTVKVTVMDRYSLAELSSVLTSAFFTLDVKKGGHGIAFGKPATRHVMDVRFPGYFDQAFHIGDQLALPVYHRLKVPKSALPCLPAIVLVESTEGVTTYLAEDGTDILGEPSESEMHTSLSDYDASNGYFHPADYMKPFVWPSAAVSGANPGWYAENDTPSGEHNPYYFTSVQLPVESGKKFYSVIDAYLQTDAGEIMKFVPEPGNTFNDYVVDMDASKPPFSNSGTDIPPTGKFFHFKHFEGCGWHSDATSGSVNGTFHVVYEVEDA